MADSSQHPSGDRPSPGDPGAAAHPPAAVADLRAIVRTLLIVAGAAVLGVAGGLVWSAVAPQAVFSVQSRGVAFVVNPETSAFIAADGWFSLVAACGGLLIGIGGYLAGVRRYGPLPVLGILAGATLAAFLASWTGSSIGLAAFKHRLGTAKAGTLISQPAQLGAHGALAFWPLAAGAAVGGIELILALRDRRRRLMPEPLAAPLPYGTPPRGTSRNGSAPDAADSNGAGGQHPDEAARYPGQYRGPGERGGPG